MGLGLIKEVTEIPFTTASERIKYLRIKPPRKAKQPYPETIRCWWKKLKNKQKERYTVFLYGENQYFKNVYITQDNLQIQCNSYQITNGIFERTGIKNLNLYGNTKDPEQPKQSWKIKMEL